MQLLLDLGLLALQRSLHDIETTSTDANRHDLLGYRSCLTYVCTIISCVCAGWSVKLRRVAMLTAFSLEPRRDILNALSMLYDPLREMERAIGSTNGSGSPHNTRPSANTSWTTAGLTETNPEITEGCINEVSAMTLMDVIQALDRIRSPELDPTLPWLLLEQVCEHYRNNQLRLVTADQPQPHLDLESHPRLQMGLDSDPLDILYSSYVKATLDSASMMECVPSLPTGAATTRDKRPVALAMEIPPAEEEMDTESEPATSISPPAMESPPMEDVEEEEEPEEEEEEEPEEPEEEEPEEEEIDTPDEASVHSDKTWEESTSPKSGSSSDTDSTDNTLLMEEMGGSEGSKTGDTPNVSVEDVLASSTEEHTESPQEAEPSPEEPHPVELIKNVASAAEPVEEAHEPSVDCDKTEESENCIPMAASDPPPKNPPVCSDLPIPLEACTASEATTEELSETPSVAQSLSSEPPPIEQSRSCESVTLEQPVALESSTVEPCTPECTPPLPVSETVPDLVVANEARKPPMVRQASLEEHTTLIETCDRLWTPTSRLEISKWASSPAGSSDSEHVQAIVAMVEPCNQDNPPMPEPLIVENIMDHPRGHASTAPQEEAENNVPKSKDKQKASSCRTAGKLDLQNSHPNSGCNRGNPPANLSSTHQLGNQPVLQNPVVVLKDVALKRSYVSQNGSGSTTVQRLALTTAGNTSPLMADVPTSMICQSRVLLSQENKPLATSSPIHKRPTNVKIHPKVVNSPLPMSVPAQALYSAGQVPTQFVHSCSPVPHLLSPPQPARVLSTPAIFRPQSTPLAVPTMTGVSMTPIVAPSQSLAPSLMRGPVMVSVAEPSQPLVTTNPAVASTSTLLLQPQPRPNLVMVMQQSASLPPPPALKDKATSVMTHPASSLIQQLTTNVAMSAMLPSLSLPSPELPTLQPQQSPRAMATVPLTPQCQISISSQMPALPGDFKQSQPVATLSTQRLGAVDTLPTPLCSCGIPAHTGPCSSATLRTAHSTMSSTEALVAPQAPDPPSTAHSTVDHTASNCVPRSMTMSLNTSHSSEQDTTVSRDTTSESSHPEALNESVEYADIAIQTDPCDDEDIMNLDFSAEDGDISIPLSHKPVSGNVCSEQPSLNPPHQPGDDLSGPGASGPCQPTTLALPNDPPSKECSQDIECISLLSSSTEAGTLDEVNEELLATTSNTSQLPESRDSTQERSEAGQPQGSSQPQQGHRPVENQTQPTPVRLVDYEQEPTVESPLLEGLLASCEQAEARQLASQPEHPSDNSQQDPTITKSQQQGSPQSASTTDQDAAVPEDPGLGVTPVVSCQEVTVAAPQPALVVPGHELSASCTGVMDDTTTNDIPISSSVEQLPLTTAPAVSSNTLTQMSPTSDHSPELKPSSLMYPMVSPSTSPRAKSPRLLDPAALQRKKVLEAGVRRAEQPINPSPRTLSPFVRKFFPHRDQLRNSAAAQAQQGQVPTFTPAPIQVQLKGKTIKVEGVSPQSSPPASVRDPPLDLDALIQETRQQISNEGYAFNFDNFKAAVLRVIQDKWMSPGQRNGEPGLTVSQDLQSMNIVLAGGASRKALRIQGLNKGVYLASKSEDTEEVRRFISEDQKVSIVNRTPNNPRLLKIVKYGDSQVKGPIQEAMDTKPPLSSLQPSPPVLPPSVPGLPVGLESLLQGSGGKVKVTIKKTNQAGSQQVFNLPITSSIFTVSTPIEGGKKPQPIIKHFTTNKLGYKIAPIKSEPGSSADSHKSPIKCEAVEVPNASKSPKAELISNASKSPKAEYISNNGSKPKVEPNYISTTHYIISNAKPDYGSVSNRKSPNIFPPKSSVVSQRKSPITTQDPNQHIPAYIITSISPANPRISPTLQTQNSVANIKKPVATVSSSSGPIMSQVSPSALPKAITSTAARTRFSGKVQVVTSNLDMSSSLSTGCTSSLTTAQQTSPAAKLAVVTSCQPGTAVTATSVKVASSTKPGLSTNGKIDVATPVHGGLKSTTRIDTPTAISVAKHPAETTSVSVAKQPAETTSVSVAKHPAETTSVSVAKQPAETTSVSVAKQPAETTSVSVAKQPVETKPISVAKQPAETTPVSVTYQPVVTTSHSVAKQLLETTSVSITKQPDEATSVSVSKQSSAATSVSVAKPPAESSRTRTRPAVKSTITSTPSPATHKPATHKRRASTESTQRTKKPCPDVKEDKAAALATTPVKSVVREEPVRRSSRSYTVVQTASSSPRCQMPAASSTPEAVVEQESAEGQVTEPARRCTRSRSLDSKQDLKSDKSQSLNKKCATTVTEGSADRKPDSGKEDSKNASRKKQDAKSNTKESKDVEEKKLSTDANKSVTTRTTVMASNKNKTSGNTNEPAKTRTRSTKYRASYYEEDYSIMSESSDSEAGADDIEEHSEPQPLRRSSRRTSSSNSAGSVSTKAASGDMPTVGEKAESKGSCESKDEAISESKSSGKKDCKPAEKNVTRSSAKSEDSLLVGSVDILSTAKECAKPKSGNKPKITDKCNSSRDKVLDKTDSTEKSMAKTKCLSSQNIKAEIKDSDTSEQNTTELSDEVGTKPSVEKVSHKTKSETGYAKAFEDFLSSPKSVLPTQAAHSRPPTRAPTSKASSERVMTSAVTDWQEEEEDSYQSGYMREYTKWFQGKTYQSRNGQRKDPSPSAKPKMSEAEEKYLKLFEQDHNVRISSQTYDNVCQQSIVHDFTRTVSPVVKVNKLEHALRRLPGSRKRHFSGSSLCSRGSVSSELSELTGSKLRRTRSSTADSDCYPTEAVGADCIVVSDDSQSENGSIVSDSGMLEETDPGPQHTLRSCSRAAALTSLTNRPVSPPIHIVQDNILHTEKPTHMIRTRSQSIDSRSQSPSESLCSRLGDCDTDQSSRSRSQSRARSRSTSRARSPVPKRESQRKRQQSEPERSTSSGKDSAAKPRSSSRLSASHSKTPSQPATQVNKKKTADNSSSTNHQKESSNKNNRKRQSEPEARGANKRQANDSNADTNATVTTSSDAPVRRSLKREAKSVWEKEFLKSINKH